MDTASDRTSSSEEVARKVEKKSSALYVAIDDGAAAAILSTVVFDRLLRTLIDTMAVCAARKGFCERVDLQIEKEIIKLINCLVVRAPFLFECVFEYFSEESGRFFGIALAFFVFGV